MIEQNGEKKFNLYPLLLLAVVFALGIFLEEVFRADVRIVFTLLFGFAILAYMFRHSPAATFLIAIAFLVLGSLCLISEKSSIRDDRVRVLIDSGVIKSGDPVEIEGVITGPLEPSAEGLVLTVDVEMIRNRGKTMSATGHVRVYAVVNDDEAAAEYDDLGLRGGSQVAIACNLIREEQYQNPGVASRVELLDRQSIDAIATLKSPLLIEKQESRPSMLSLDSIYTLRQNLIEQFRTRFSPSTAGVLTASMLGDKYFLDKRTADVFREGGTFHVLVISGLHITFIGGVLVLLVSSVTRKPVIQFVVVSAALWAYTFAVGADVPVIRASVMFTVLIFSRVIHRQGSLLNSFGAALLALLAWRPSDLFNPSFQLTVASVAAIVVIAFPLIEKMRAIGSWMPTTATPFPPNVPERLRRSCEMLYWRPTRWTIETSRQIWSARIFKAPYLASLALRGGQKTVSYVFEGLVVSLIVQICLLPLLIVYFHRISPVSIVMNLWIGVAIAAESFAALAAIILSSVSEFLAAPFASVTEFFNYLLVVAPKVFVRSDWASWRVPNYSGGASVIYAIYFLPVICVSYVLWSWGPFAISSKSLVTPVFDKRLNLGTALKILSCTIALFVCILVFHPYSAPSPEGRLHIDFLDVGQGDSALVTFPDGTMMLIDGGGRAEFRDRADEENAFEADRPGIGESVVSPVLWNKGYSGIDYILATHADADHIQGLNEVAANFEIGEALFGRMPENDPEFLELAEVLRQRGVSSEFVHRGETFKFGDAVLEVLYPRTDPSPNAPSDNNHSVVVRIVYGKRAFLLTGDIEQAAELDLVNGGGVLMSDLIKVADHGSRTSSTQEFINAVHPLYAVISVGRRSRFGHPHREVVDRWASVGSNVLTTGDRGMISVSTDGRDLSVQTFK